MSDQRLFWPDRLAYLGAGVLIGGVLGWMLFGGNGDAGSPSAPPAESSAGIGHAPPPANLPEFGKIVTAETTVAPIVAETTTSKPHAKVSETPIALAPGAPQIPDTPLDRWVRTKLPADPLVCYLFDKTRPLSKPNSGRLMRPVKVPDDIKPGQTLSREDALRLQRVLRAPFDLDLEVEGPIVRDHHLRVGMEHPTEIELSSENATREALDILLICAVPLQEVTLRGFGEA